ncbi:MAG: glycine cleavage system regulatory protein [Paraglaciecola sp.]|jgi:glycine cleavage system regulatory protein
MKPMIFTLVGRDKPGLIESLAQTVFNMGGNWLASNFSHMAGHFAGFVQIDLPADKYSQLVDTFSRHSDLRIHLVEGSTVDVSNDITAQIDIMGNDKAGIVQELTSILAQFNINIVKFDSSCGSAPNWGSSMFKARATISMAKDFDVEPLREALEEVANDLMVDIDLQ